MDAILLEVDNFTVDELVELKDYINHRIGIMKMRPQLVEMVMSDTSNPDDNK